MRHAVVRDPRFRPRAVMRVLLLFSVFSVFSVLASAVAGAPPESGPPTKGGFSSAAEKPAEPSPRTWYVTPPGTDTDRKATLNVDGTFTDLQEAIDFASSGDTILIGVGIHYGNPTPYVDPSCGNCGDFNQPSNVNVGFHVAGKVLTLRGDSRTGTVLETRSNYGLLFENAGASRVESLTITGGVRSDESNATDAAILARYTQLTVSGVDVVGNTDTHYFPSIPWLAGIVGIAGREGSDLAVSNSRIEGNSWDGIALYRSDPAVGDPATAIVTDSVIANGSHPSRSAAFGATWDSQAVLARNRIYGHKKGIGFHGSSTGSVYNNLIYDIGWWGFTAAVTPNLVRVVNNVFDDVVTPIWSLGAGDLELVNNVVVNSLGGVVVTSAGVPVMRYNDIYLPSYPGREVQTCPDGYPYLAGCVTETLPATNLTVAPQFSDPGNHVYALSCSSPLIDAGDPAISDVDGSRSDVGANGGPFSGTPPPTCGGECSAHHGNVSACDATPGCAYYFCSDQCHPVGTSNCDAGCTGQCPSQCSDHHGDVTACDAAPGCAYYFCSDQCHPVGTPSCEAGCGDPCPPDDQEVCDGIDNDEDGQTDEGNVCDCTTVLNGGHSYRFCETAVSWQAAAGACAAQGYALVKVNGAVENAWVDQQSAGTSRWLGLSDQHSEGLWRWQDGELETGGFWSTYEPNGGTNENCAQMWPGGGWNDLNCSWDNAFVCEEELPEEGCVEGVLLYSGCMSPLGAVDYPVDLEEDQGGGWVPVGTVDPDANGNFCATLRRNRQYRLRKEDVQTIPNCSTGPTATCYGTIYLEDPFITDTCSESSPDCEQLDEVDFYCGS